MTLTTGIVQLEAQHAEATDAWAFVRACIAGEQDAMRVILRTVDLYELAGHLAGLVADIGVDQLGSLEALDDLLAGLQDRRRAQP